MAIIPPASPGLPPAGIDAPNQARDRHRNKYPAKRGPMSQTEKTHVVETVMSQMDTTSPNKIARILSRDPGTIKSVIKTARQTLQMRAADYVDAHWTATQVAAGQGDAKPAQWAMERIAEGEQRIVEKEKAGASAPSLQIGIAIGGMPHSSRSIDITPITHAELPDHKSTYSPTDDTP
jgi:hypothetical protein